MRRKMCVLSLTGLALLGLLAGPAWTQDATEAQNKLLAKRAAEADAYRKLAECVKGLFITSDTTVRDFVTESDVIRTELDTFIRAVRLGHPTWYDDGTCEVPAEVTVAKVITHLKEIHARHYKGNRLQATDFEKMKQRETREVIRVVGMGAPRPDLPPDLPEGVAEELYAGSPPPPRPAIPEIWSQVPPQERLMAKRAAEVDALRRLAERIIGLRITSDTLVRDFVTESDVIRTECRAMIRGATERRTYYHSNDLIVEVTMEVPVTQVITIIKELHARHYRGNRVTAVDIDKIKVSLKKQTFEATGMGVPRPDVIAQVIQVQSNFTPPGWITEEITATGQGTDPAIESAQGKLMAARAAELDAKRRLAEQVMGLRITGDTTVRDFVTEQDRIQTRVDAVLLGSYVKDTRFLEDGTAEVIVALPGPELWRVIYAEWQIVYRAG